MIQTDEDMVIKAWAKSQWFYLRCMETGCMNRLRCMETGCMNWLRCMKTLCSLLKAECCKVVMAMSRCADRRGHSREINEHFGGVI